MEAILTQLITIICYLAQFKDEKFDCFPKTARTSLRPWLVGLNLSPVASVYYSIIMNTMHIFLQLFPGTLAVLGCLVSFYLQLATFVAHLPVCNLCESWGRRRLADGGHNFCQALQVFSRILFWPLFSRNNKQQRAKKRGRESKGERHQGKLHC